MSGHRRTRRNRRTKQARRADRVLRWEANFGETKKVGRWRVYFKKCAMVRHRICLIPLVRIYVTFDEEGAYLYREETSHLVAP